MDKIREVRIAPYRKGMGPRFTLTLFDTHKTDSMGKCIVGYQFRQSGRLIFNGEDFHCSPLHGIDSDECVRSLLSFLTLRIGDTDREYFANYTPEQEDFRDNLTLCPLMLTTDSERIKPNAKRNRYTRKAYWHAQFSQ